MQKFKDRNKGGKGLEESPWLVDQENVDQVRELANKKGVTPGEMFRFVIRTGLVSAERL